MRISIEIENIREIDKNIEAQEKVAKGEVLTVGDRQVLFDTLTVLKGMKKAIMKKLK